VIAAARSSVAAGEYQQNINIRSWARKQELHIVLPANPQSAAERKMIRTPSNIESNHYRTMVAAFMLVAGLAVFSVHAATPQTVGTRTLDYSELIGGPTVMTVRTMTIAPGEVLGWHQHPGAGCYTIVVSGTLTVEDGCGGEATYTQGQVFHEPAGRVHRGKNLTAAAVVTAQTFLAPPGMPVAYPLDEPTCGTSPP
jgi:quercetin dioxygenase-like cupin family protein